MRAGRNWSNFAHTHTTAAKLVVRIIILLILVVVENTGTPQAAELHKRFAIKSNRLALYSSCDMSINRIKTINITS